MAGAVGDLQIGVQHRAVQGGGHLADAAAQLLHHLAVGVGAGLFKARGLGTLAHGVVIRELLAGVEDGAVDLLRRQRDVVDTVGGAGFKIGHLSAQLVLEQLGAEIVGGDLGLGDLQRNGHRVARGGGVPQLLGLGHIEIHAYHGLRHLALVGIVGGVLDLGVDLVVESLNIQLGILAVRGLVVHLAEAAGLQRRHHQIVDSVFVHGHIGGALHHGEHGLVRIHLIGLAGEGVLHLGHAVADLAADVIRIQILRGGGQIHAPEKSPDVFEEAGKKPAVPAVAIGGPGRGLGGGDRAGLSGVHGDLNVRRQDHGDVFTGLVVPAALPQGRRGLFLGHAAHRHAAHGDIGIDGIRRAQGKARARRRHTQHRQYDGDDQ